ncbi:pyridoxal-phosphate dependent enzyme [Chromatiaceae bacterium AAb-1]|nr:pyridoxal-phosphate dependent enzyme [Chromatiaceae bacterium AAb-1]
MTEDPLISGNKYLKLKYPLNYIKENCKKGILTFGGAFSNHLIATAAACQYAGLESVGYVRTDVLDDNNPTLQACRQRGMQLQCLSRTLYRERYDRSFIEQLQQQYPEFLIVPEGGSSEWGMQGVAEFNLEYTPAGKADLIVSATASGGTLAGIIKGSQTTAVTGIAVTADSSLPGKIKQLLSSANVTCSWQLNTYYTGKGYARFTPELLQFCRQLQQTSQLSTEPVYTGKALYGLFAMVQNGEIAPGSRISFFHTGGLQGLTGLYYRRLISQDDFVLLSATTAG